MIYKTKDDVEQVIALRKPENVINHFAESYLQGIEYEAWRKAEANEHSGLYPTFINGEPLYDVDGITIIAYEQIPNPDYIDFDTYMAETEQVEVGTKDILDEDGITVIGTEPIYEDRLIRQYIEVVVDIEGWKATSELWKGYLDAIKDDTLNRLTVTTSSGKVFYADPTSRSDLTDAILLGQSAGITETAWKLAKEFNGSRYAVVTITELAEAAMLALQTKGQIVGAIQ